MSVNIFFMVLSGMSFVIAIIFTATAFIKNYNKVFLMPLALCWGGSFLLLSLELIMPKLAGWQGWLTALLGVGLIITGTIRWTITEKEERERIRIERDAIESERVDANRRKLSPKELELKMEEQKTLQEKYGVDKKRLDVEMRRYNNY